MRCYHLSNMYLSSIQAGLQSAHSQMELFVKYSGGTPKGVQLYEWALNHKTMIILNGGFLSTMKEVLEFLDSEDNPYPWSVFYESEEAMGGMLTNIAIVLPEKIYETADLIRRRQIVPTLHILPGQDEETILKVVDQMKVYGRFSEFEIKMCNRLNNFGLAS